MLQAVLAKVIDTFPDYKDKPQTGDPWDEWFTQKVSGQLSAILHQPGDLAISATSGMGNRAEIPWIGFRRLDSTINFQGGIYAAYLFKRDRSGVLLSLLYGVGKNKGRKWDAARRADARRLRAHYLIPERMKLFEAELGGIYSTPRAYDDSHICGRWYDRGDLPDDQSLLADLVGLLTFYQSMDGIDISATSITDNRPGVASLPATALQNEMMEDSDRFYEDTAGKLPPSPDRITRLATIFRRDSALAKDLKKKQNYRCERCNGQTAWLGSDNNPYVECHHLVPLGENGSDDVRNLIVLCSDCHRFLHYSDAGQAETQRLLNSREKSHPYLHRKH